MLICGHRMQRWASQGAGQPEASPKRALASCRWSPETRAGERRIRARVKTLMELEHVAVIVLHS